MSTKRSNIEQYLKSLVGQYEALEVERDFLINGVQARLTAVNDARQEVVAEAQEQLNRLNVIRALAGEPELTLQQVRNFYKNRGPRSR